jgi:hypothetical protein
LLGPSYGARPDQEEAKLARSSCVNQGENVTNLDGFYAVNHTMQIDERVGHAESASGNEALSLSLSLSLSPVISLAVY